MAAQITTPILPLLPTPCRRLLRSLGELKPMGPSRTRSRRLVVACAASGGGPPAEKPPQGPSLPPLSEIRWGQLLAPSPDNAAAVALTAALVWAGAALLLQLVLISASIFAAALKYSFVAALLLFVLIALL
ncbi:uncharacterized protein LOC119298326 [Triticum dicoccoides]|uniref:Uncharacterized protein n=2 Tax=Triticum TaxID=4564 RepID=A0A9R0U1V9_TRITD|nr:uncharacterized protein LOC119298326 [Triticum dicoccoides]VAI24224.1 unnamed protein product [Triticum turgidum subsp. durum]